MNLLLLKLKLLVAWIDLKFAVKKFRYCRKGYHFVEMCHEAIDSSEVSLRVDYMKCKVCSLMIFVNPEGEKTYLQIQDWDKIQKKKLFDSMIKNVTKTQKD